VLAGRLGLIPESHSAANETNPQDRP
jgi:hypothetical protein